MTAAHLAALALGYTPEKPLYVIAIGAITNVASALLMKPEIKDRIVLIWLGGNAHEWPDNKEFNLFQDVAAARVVFGCGAALVQLPCMGVVSSFNHRPRRTGDFSPRQKQAVRLSDRLHGKGRRSRKQKTAAGQG